MKCEKWKGVKGDALLGLPPPLRERGGYPHNFYGIAPGEREVTLPDRISLFLKTIAGTICHPVFPSLLKNVCGSSNGTIPNCFNPGYPLSAGDREVFS
jgi:hypothetical protein